MESMDATDAVLIRTCAELEALLASYAADCGIVEQAECDLVEAPDVEDARLRQQRTAKRWRSTLKRMGELPAGTKRGALAKNRALQACFEHHLAEDVDVMALVRSHTLDLDRLLSEDREMPLHVPLPVAARRALFRFGGSRMKARS